VNILLVSQCEKRGLTETRRILDQYAERFGERTWQTPITKAGLDTLRRVLKKTARRNTAVACHWIHGKNHSELLWIVGNVGKFNSRGVVPTNTTSRNILRSQDENNWHSAEVIRLLAMIAALFHDFGKANKAFIEKLVSKKPMADAYRHEWVSLRLFEAFVREEEDTEWLSRLMNLQPGEEKSWSEKLKRDDHVPGKGPFGNLKPLARIIGWLIVSHHRLPVLADGVVSPGKLRNLPLPILPAWNSAIADASKSERAACWEFPKGLPFDSRSWCLRANSCAQKILEHPTLAKAGIADELLHDPYVLHVSRLVLMLADHHYSSLPSDKKCGDVDYPLFANTDRKTRQLKQRLDEHLIGVATHARRIAGILPRLDAELPRLARHKGFQRRTKDARFGWQNKAYELAVSVRSQAEAGGFFGVNMASTGCGKTLANGRIMYGLAHPERGARFSIALGLRTLTLQTGSVYRERLDLGEDDLAILVGGAAVRELHALGESEAQEIGVHEWNGSESAEDIFEENAHVHYEANLSDGPLKNWLADNTAANKLISAPVLTCTIDHLIPATESTRGGRQIAPMLRLLTSDLVLDEPDDFGMEDLPALSRLVHWAGLLGSKILLSSATLPPSMVQGLFNAYRAGREVFDKNRGIPGQHTKVCCAWFDEFKTISEAHRTEESFLVAHNAFVTKREARIREVEFSRRTRIIETPFDSKEQPEILESLAQLFSKSMTELHELHHSIDPATGKRVSFGLVRMANIDPLIEIARTLFKEGAPQGVRVHLCVYHSKHPLVVRAAIERRLDRCLKRHEPDAVFRLPDIRKELDERDEENHLFVVLASPVAEVGRDHDYDWAIVEPSSMRSIIQLAGRIRRHRPGLCKEPNIYLLDKNVKGLLGRAIAFDRPGFEAKPFFELKDHALSSLLTGEQLGHVHSGPRIVERPVLDSTQNLVDLEHARLRALMLNEGENTDLPIHLWWSTQASLSAELQRKQRFRAGPPETTYAFLPNEDDSTDLIFHQQDELGSWKAPASWIPQENLIKRDELEVGLRIQTWGSKGLGAELEHLQDRFDKDLSWVAQHYGTVQLQEQTQGWRYEPTLGFQRCK